MRILHSTGLLFAVFSVTATFPWAVTPLSAGESVLLHTGYRLHAERHEAVGDQVRLYQGEGFVELPASVISGFESEPESLVLRYDVPKPAVVPMPVISVQPKAVAALTPHEMAAMAAKKFELPVEFVRSVMKAESNFRADVVSPKGAIGLMQLMQATAEHLGVNPRDPKQNAEGGAQYLRELLVKYQHHPDQVILALAAYNAGPGAVEKYHGVPPYRETREYVLRVLRIWDKNRID